jgi:hypothetical protein
MPQTKSVSSNTPKGKSPALPILFLCITVGILGVGGFVVYKTVNKSGGSPLNMVKDLAGGNAFMPRATENDFASISDPLIRKHLAAQVNVGSYRTTSTSNGMGKNDSQVMEFEIKGQDVSFRMAQTIDGKPTSDMITIGGVTYVKDFKDNSWWMQKAKPVSETDSKKDENEYKFDDIKDEYMKKVDVVYTKLGEEACGARTCYKYQEVSDDNKEAKRIFWFDTKELLLRREESGFGEFTSVSEYTYDVTVKAPSPTKQVPEGKSIYEYMIATPTLSEDDKASMKEYEKMMNSPETEKMMKQFESMMPQGSSNDYEDYEEVGY